MAAWRRGPPRRLSARPGHARTSLGLAAACSTLLFTSTDPGSSFAGSRIAADLQTPPRSRTGRAIPRQSGAVEVLHQQECLDGLCGNWELKTLQRDIKESSALGIEIRQGSVEVALVDLDGGRLLNEPTRIELNITDRKFYADAVSKALRMATADLQWKGVVGCVVTKLASGYLGVTDAYFTALQRRIGQVLTDAGLRGAFTHAMLPAEAAGYAELAASNTETNREDDSSWRRLVVVVTIGAKLDAVLFKDGHRVRRSGINTMISTGWSTNSTTQVPEVDDPRWPEFAHHLDLYLRDIVELTSPDRIVVVPIGVLAARTRLEEALASDLAERPGLTIELTAYPAHALVRGSALAALVELRSVSARLVMQQALEGTTKLSVLSPAQLRAVFDAFDLDGSGALELRELQSSLDTMGISRDISDVFEDEDVQAMQEFRVTFERFQRWWSKYVANANVLQVSSMEDVERLVGMSQAEVNERFGPLLVLEVTFSYCRVCRSFANKYDQLAKTYADVRFLQVQGNLNRGTMGLVKRLNVTKAPAFFMYRRGSALEDPIAVWHGGNVTRFRSNMEAAKTEEENVLA